MADHSGPPMLGCRLYGLERVLCGAEMPLSAHDTARRALEDAIAKP